MNIFVNFFALAGLMAASSVVGESVRAPAAAARQEQRRLDEDLCLMCELCDALSDLCDFGLIQDFACITCDEDDDDDDDDPDSDICFSELATVQVLQPGGGRKEISVQMKDLKVGDQILTGMNKYDTVYAFGHNNPTRTATFYQIYNEESENPLEITADHMVFLQDKENPVAASKVKVGDVLTSFTGPSKVIKISTVERNGIYAPLTTGGSLLVDGVKTSSYIAIGQKSLLSDHSLIHMTLSPYRMVCAGISQHFCKPESYNDDGMPYYVEYGLGLLHWMNNSNDDSGSSSILKALVFAAVIGLNGACWSLELLFGASLAPLMVFIATVAYISQLNNKKNKAKVL